jgi:hypothetical protein
MGFLERRAERSRQATEDNLRQSRPESRYGTKPGRVNPDPVGFPTAAAAGSPGTEQPPGRADLAQLLGRTVLEARVQQICREYGLIPRSGGPGGSGLSRSYLAREAGVEIAADGHGMVTAVFLHFHGDDGFASYRGEIPGGGGTAATRASLWAALGRPDASGDPYRERFLGDFGPWDRWLLPGLQLRAQYALDGDGLHRITLTRPGAAT